MNIKDDLGVWGYDSMLEHLPSVYEVLRLIITTGREHS